MESILFYYISFQIIGLMWMGILIKKETIAHRDISQIAWGDGKVFALDTKKLLLLSFMNLENPSFGIKVSDEILDILKNYEDETHLQKCDLVCLVKRRSNGVILERYGDMPIEKEKNQNFIEVNLAVFPYLEYLKKDSLSFYDKFKIKYSQYLFELL